MQNFNKIYKDYYSKLLGYTNSKLNNIEVSQELTNDIMMKVNQNLHKYDKNIAKFSTWFFNIANNTIIDYMRKVKLPTVSINDYESDGEDNNGSFIDLFSNHNRTPENEMILGEADDDFTSAIKSLSKTYSPIGEAFFIEDLNYKEVSNKLEIPINTVKVKVKRIREILKNKYEISYNN